MWPQLTVKNCYHIVTKNCPQVLDYLPTPHGQEQRLPERDFFWTVMWTLLPQETEDYIQQVEKERRPKVNLQDQKFGMIVDESYMNELLKYDFTSTKKGRGFTSLLVERKRKKVYDYTTNMNTYR